MWGRLPPLPLPPNEGGAGTRAANRSWPQARRHSARRQAGRQTCAQALRAAALLRQPSPGPRQSIRLRRWSELLW
jgi:hypothetical protein